MSEKSEGRGPSSDEVADLIRMIREGNFDAAEEQANAMIRFYPDNYIGWKMKGSLLKLKGNAEAALPLLMKSIGMCDHDADLFNNLGVTLRDLGRQNEAVEACRKAISLKPDLFDAYCNLGNSLKDLGHRDEAIATFRKVLEINPEHAESYYNLAALMSFDKEEAYLRKMEALHKRQDLPAKDRMILSFALGNIYEKMDRHKDAFYIYNEGNKIRHSQLSHTIDLEKQHFEFIRNAFSGQGKTRTVPFMKAQPILVIGMPRSGTSLIEQILASHSMVHGAGEQNLLEKAFRRNTAKSGQIDIEKTAVEYFEKMDALASGKSWVTDKMPQNFLLAGIVLAVNPEIRVVHVMRDPIATCWSIYKRNFTANGFGAAYDLADLAEYYKLYQDLMAFWHERFPGKIYDLEYEKLTENQKEETRKLLEYCGLPWEDACLNFHETKRAVRTASASQVRERMYKGSNDAWRPYEPYLGVFLKGLGKKTIETGIRNISQTESAEAITAITIDDKVYAAGMFSQEALSHLANLQFVDKELAKLQAKMAIYQTARMAYARALNESLPVQESDAAKLN